jgi:hypothetical protein
VLGFAMPFTSLGVMHCQNHFAEPNQHVSTFLHPILFCMATFRTPVELLKSTNEGGEVKGQNERTLKSQLDYSK